MIKKVLHKIIGHRIYSLILFRKHHGYWMDLKNPRTLNEKITYLKIQGFRQSYTEWASKSGLKMKLDSLGLSRYVVPSLYEGSVRNIPWNEITYPVVFKTSCGSGDFTLVNSIPDLLGQAKLSESLKKALSTNLFWSKGEQVYKQCEGKVIIEPYLGLNHVFRDVKVHMFNGQPELFYVTSNRFEDISRAMYDSSGNFIDASWSHFKKGSPKYVFKKLDESVDFNKFKIIAVDLVKHIGAPYVRIDFIETDTNVFIGEITFYHMNGLAKFYPKELDLALGNRLNLINEK